MANPNPFAPNEETETETEQAPETFRETPLTDTQEALRQEAAEIAARPLTRNPERTLGDILDHKQLYIVSQHSLYGRHNDPRYNAAEVNNIISRALSLYDREAYPWEPEPPVDLDPGIEQARKSLSYLDPSRGRLGGLSGDPAADLMFRGTAAAGEAIANLPDWAEGEKRDLAARGINPDLTYPQQWTQRIGGKLSAGHTLMRTGNPRILRKHHLKYMLDQSNPDPSREVEPIDRNGLERGMMVRDRTTRAIFKERGEPEDSWMLYEAPWVNLPAIPQDILRDFPAFGAAFLAEIAMYRLGAKAMPALRQTIQRGRGKLFDPGPKGALIPGWKGGVPRVKEARFFDKLEEAAQGRGFLGKVGEVGAVSVGAAGAAMLFDLARLWNAQSAPVADLYGAATGEDMASILSSDTAGGWNNVTFSEAVEDAGGIALMAGLETAAADVLMRGVILTYNMFRGVPLPDASLAKLRADIEQYRRSGRGIKVPLEEFSIKELQDTVRRLTQDMLTDAPTQSRLKQLFYKVRQKFGGQGEVLGASPMEYTPTLGDAVNSQFAQLLQEDLLQASEIFGPAFQAYLKLIEGNDEMLAAVYDGIQAAYRTGDVSEWWPTEEITAETLKKALRAPAEEMIAAQRFLVDPKLVDDAEVFAQGELLLDAERGVDGPKVPTPKLTIGGRPKPQETIAPLQERVPTGVSRAYAKDRALLFKFREDFMQPVRDTFESVLKKYEGLRTGAGFTAPAMRQVLKRRKLSADELLATLDSAEFDEFLETVFVIRRNEMGQGISTIKRMLGVDPLIEEGTGKFVNPQFSLRELNQAEEVLNEIYGSYPGSKKVKGAAKEIMDAVEQQVDKMGRDGAEALMREQGLIPSTQKSVSRARIERFQDETGYFRDFDAAWKGVKDAVQTGEVGFLRDIVEQDLTRVVPFLLNAEPRKTTRLLEVLESQGAFEQLNAIRRAIPEYIQRNVLDPGADTATNLAAFKSFLKEKDYELEAIYGEAIYEGKYRTFSQFGEEVLKREKKFEDLLQQIEGDSGESVVNIVEKFLDSSHWKGRSSGVFESERARVAKLINQSPELKRMANHVTLEWLNKELTGSGPRERVIDWDTLHQLVNEGIEAGPSGTISLGNWFKPWLGEKKAYRFASDLRQLDVLAQRIGKASDLEFKAGLGEGPTGGGMLSKMIRFFVAPLSMASRRFHLGKNVLSERSMMNLARGLLNPEILEKFIRLRDRQVTLTQFNRILAALDVTQEADFGAPREYVGWSQDLGQLSEEEQERRREKEDLGEAAFRMAGELPGDVSRLRKGTLRTVGVDVPAVGAGLGEAALNSLIDFIEKNSGVVTLTPEDLEALREERAEAAELEAGARAMTDG